MENESIIMFIYIGFFVGMLIGSFIGFLVEKYNAIFIFMENKKLCKILKIKNKYERKDYLKNIL